MPRLWRNFVILRYFWGMKHFEVVCRNSWQNWALSEYRKIWKKLAEMFKSFGKTGGNNRRNKNEIFLCMVFWYPIMDAGKRDCLIFFTCRIGLYSSTSKKMATQQYDVLRSSFRRWDYFWMFDSPGKEF